MSRFTLSIHLFGFPAPQRSTVRQLNRVLPEIAEPRRVLNSYEHRDGEGVYFKMVSHIYYKKIPVNSVSIVPKILDLLRFDCDSLDETSDEKSVKSEGGGRRRKVSGSGEEIENPRWSLSHNHGRTSDPITFVREILSFDNGSNKCSVCYYHSCDSVFEECSHGGICVSCARSIYASSNPVCPICRETIQAIHQIDTNHSLSIYKVQVSYSHK